MRYLLSFILLFCVSFLTDAKNIDTEDPVFFDIVQMEGSDLEVVQGTSETLTSELRIDTERTPETERTSLITSALSSRYELPWSLMKGERPDRFEKRGYTFSARSLRGKLFGSPPRS